MLNFLDERNRTGGVHREAAQFATIILHREDLITSKKKKLTRNISIYDFKASSLSKEDIRKADSIAFVDGISIKVLKNKYK